MSVVASEQAGRRIAELFDAHARMVLGLCRLILRDPGEAEDAAQQTFLSAYRSLLSGTAPREPAPWLATIARNECRTRLRRRQPTPLPAVDEPTTRDAAELADERERIELLTAAIAELPDRQRQALVLRDLRGLSNAEVAEVLDVAPAAVEALVGRGRRRVRTMFRRARPTLVVVPVTLRGELARLIPHFETATATAGGAGVVGAGVAKVAVSVTTVAVALGGSVEAEHAVAPPVQRPAAAPAPRVAKPRPRHPPAPRATPVALHAPAPQPRPQPRDDSSGPGPGTRSDRRGDAQTPSSGGDESPSDSSGPGPGVLATPVASDVPTTTPQPPDSSGPGPGTAPTGEPASSEQGPSASQELDSSGHGGGGDDGGARDGSNSGPG